VPGDWDRGGAAVIRYGDLAALRAIRNTMKGYDEKMQRMRFVNVWVEK
jgi:hypothetical protein